MKMTPSLRKIFMAAALLLAPVSAWANCSGPGGIPFNCDPLPSPQFNDYVLLGDVNVNPNNSVKTSLQNIYDLFLSASGISVNGVTASAPLASSGGSLPNISLTGNIPVANGGLNTSTAPTIGQILIAQSGTGYLPETLSGDCAITSLGVITCTGSGGTPFGTAAFANLGTSGAVVPLLNGNNTYSGNNSHFGTENFTSTFQINGTAQTFPGSGLLVGTTDTQTLTGKTISGASNTLTNIGNTSLTNSSMTIGGQSVALGGSTTNQGTGSKIQLSTGTTANGHCVQFDSTGNTVDAGGACTTGGGGGTVAAGLTSQLAYYSTGGTTVVGLTIANNAVLVTNGSGIPSESTTLPSALTIPSPTFSGTVAGAGTIPNNVLANSSMTIAGHSVSLGGTQTIAYSDLSSGAPTATASVLGLVKPDGTTICNSTGAISACPLTGDLTTSGVTATFATVNSNVGTFTNPSVTVNAKGLITAISSGSATSKQVFTATCLISCSTNAGSVAQFFSAMGVYNYTSTPSELQTELIIPINGTFKNLVVNTQNSPGSTRTYVFTFRKNGSSTTLTCTVSNPNNGCTDTTHTVSIVSGDMITIQELGPTAGTLPGFMNVGVEFDPS